LIIVGIIFLLFCVFGVFALFGGNISILIAALPVELTTILGAGVASIFIANDWATVRLLFKAILKLGKRPKWEKDDFISTIILVMGLLREFRVKGPKSIESDIENPFESQKFLNYPKLLADTGLVTFICDSLRLMVASTGTLDPYGVDEMMQAALKKQSERAMRPVNIVQSLSNALPALGIVACVLGSELINH
jgi:chemotaxis protein MotA